MADHSLSLLFFFILYIYIYRSNWGILRKRKKK